MRTLVSRWFCDDPDVSWWFAVGLWVISCRYMLKRYEAYIVTMELRVLSQNAEVKSRL